MFSLYYAKEQDGSPITAWEFVQAYATLANAQKRADKDLVAYYQIEMKTETGWMIVFKSEEK